MYIQAHYIHPRIRSILALLGTSLAFFCGTGFMNGMHFYTFHLQDAKNPPAFGIFQAYYQQHQLSNHSEFDISWLGSFGMFMMFACAPPAGLLTDKVGESVSRLHIKRYWPARQANVLALAP